MARNQLSTFVATPEVDHSAARAFAHQALTSPNREMRNLALAYLQARELLVDVAERADAAIAALDSGVA